MANEKRLIDANEARRRIIAFATGLHSEVLPVDTVILLLIQMLPVDAVEVVRKPVKGYEGYYEVDQFGRVFGLERIIKVNDNGRNYEKPIAGKQLKQSMHTKGYKTVSLTKDGKTKTLFVHRLVARQLIGR